MKKLRCSRIVGLGTLLCFCWFAFAAASEPANQAEKAKAEGQAEQSGNGAAMAPVGEADGPGVVEKAPSGARAVKKKKFPWLIVAGVAVAATAAAVYFLVLNKKYTLTVTLGEGVQGSPAAGTQKLKKGSTVTYGYSLQNGYKDLSVKVDGTAAAASGSITMNGNHTIDVTAVKAAALVVNSNPSGAMIYLNGSNSGQVTPHTFNYDAGGTYTVIVRKNGYKDYKTSATVALGSQTTVSANLTAGHGEEFEIEASGYWQPKTASEWTVASGNYVHNSRIYYSNYNVLNIPWPGANYSVQTRFMQKYGTLMWPRGVLLLTNPATLPTVSGYAFTISHNGYYIIFRYSNYNLSSASGGMAILKNWTPHASIAGGLEAWNIFRIVKQGSDYSFYINNLLVYSFTDTTFDPRYAGLLIDISDKNTEIQYDYFTVDLGATARK